MIFLDSGSMGIIDQLMLTTATWRKQRSKNECTCGLRQALMGAMLIELEARMAKLATDTTAQTPLVRAKILLQDPLRWQYTRWNQEKQAHEPTNGAPLTTRNGPNRTSRVEVPHSAGGHDACIPCNGRYERGEGGSHALQADPVKVAIREILTQFTESSVLRLIGAGLRPERSHRPLPKELQQLLRPEQ